MTRPKRPLPCPSPDTPSADRCAPAPGEVFALLDQVARQLRRIHRQTMRTTSLTPPQYAVLTALGRGSSLPPAELAARSGCTRATMTGILDTLERGALVERTPHPKDRRSLLVRLTPEGDALRARTPNLDHLFGGCCAGLSPQEVCQLMRLLKKLSGSLGVLSGRTPANTPSPPQPQGDVR